MKKNACLQIWPDKRFFFIRIRKSFCFTGSFMDYQGSYADNGRFDFQIPSFPVISVDKDKNVNCKIYWADNI